MLSPDLSPQLVLLRAEGAVEIARTSFGTDRRSLFLDRDMGRAPGPQPYAVLASAVLQGTWDPRQP